MIVRLVTHGDFLLLNFSPELMVGVLAAGAVHGFNVVLEDAPRLLEQTIHRQDGRGQRGTVLPFQEKLRMGMSLRRGLPQPVDGLLLVRWNSCLFPEQFAQQILGIEFVRLRRLF